MCLKPLKGRWGREGRREEGSEKGGDGGGAGRVKAYVGLMLKLVGFGIKFNAETFVKGRFLIVIDPCIRKAAVSVCDGGVERLCRFPRAHSA